MSVPRIYSDLYASFKTEVCPNQVNVESSTVGTTSTICGYEPLYSLSASQVSDASHHSNAVQC